MNTEYTFSQTFARYWAPVAVIAIGLVGLHFNVDYSGWVLFAGILGLFDWSE